MSQNIIQVRGLSKRYRLGQFNAGSLREEVEAFLKGRRGSAATSEFWAVKDIDFDVARGEAVGIIGRNGAGKSTLLKLLSRVTEPTAGEVRIRGRVASLLEVGTGFHPELTGRENIFLNGAILGMTRAEIRRRFDEIVAFAEVERFLNTPVKRYSSGMYVRLAFAVAAHLEPEILIVDEVLAVGDAEFQRKCLGKMQSVASAGRTVLFVSHNMSAIRRLCQSAVLLEAGRVAYVGPTAEAIGRYVANGDGSENDLPASTDLRERKRVAGDTVRIERATFVGRPEGAIFNVFERIRLRFHLQSYDAKDMSRASVWVLFRNATGDDVLMIMQKDAGESLPVGSSAHVDLAFENILAPGRYSLACGLLGDGKEVWDWVDDAVRLEVLPVLEGAGAYDSRLGGVTLRSEWRSSTYLAA